MRVKLQYRSLWINEDTALGRVAGKGCTGLDTLIGWMDGGAGVDNANASGVATDMRGLVAAFPLFSKLDGMSRVLEAFPEPTKV